MKIDNTRAWEKVTVNKPWLYRTQAAWMTQQSPCNNVRGIRSTQMNLSEVTQQRATFWKVWTSKVSEEGLTSKELPDGSFISVFLCYKNKSAFNAHLMLHKHNLLYPLFPVYVLERSLCGRKENIIYMHMPIRPMNPDSRQLASQSRSAESKWKWELRAEFTQWLWQKQRT